MEEGRKASDEVERGRRGRISGLAQTACAQIEKPL
jgi:hypothetical protein